MFSSFLYLMSLHESRNVKIFKLSDNVKMYSYRIDVFLYVK